MIHTFFPFIHLTHHVTQVFFFLVVFFKLYTKSSPPQPSFLFHHSTKSLFFLSLWLFSSPSLFLSLRTGPLQHTQVIVLFGGPQFEEAGPAVVKFEGSTLGSHGAWEHCHDRVEVSRIAAVALRHGPRPGRGSWPRGPCTRTGATAACSSSASLGLLQPLDLGTTHRQLVEELFSIWTWNPLWQVCYLEYSTYHWTKKRQGELDRDMRC